jgi:PKHD-type hydroxylase
MSDKPIILGLEKIPNWNFIYPTHKNSVIPRGVCVDGVFQPDELKQIIEYCANLTLTPGSIQDKTTMQTKVRKSNIAFFPTNEENQWWTSRINHCLSTVNDQAFDFILTGFIGFQYTEYDSDGSHYDWHMDTFLGAPEEAVKAGQFDSHMRKLSLSIILSDPDEYEGGILEVDAGGVDKPMQNKGDFIFFPAFVRHRVTPVTKGKRKSIVVWAVGPKFR